MTATFDPADSAGISACFATVGYAVVRDVASADLVAALRADVARVLRPQDLAPGASAYSHAFVEQSPALLRLLELPRFTAVWRTLLGTDAVTVHRSAAIVRMPGSAGCAWHTDQWPHGIPADRADGVLNVGEWPNGLWFYLDGSHPDRGGLAVIPGSHRADWPGLPGNPRVAENQLAHEPRFDQPEVAAVHSAPGDLIVFAARTWHGAFPHPGPQPRLSCGLALRPRAVRIAAPWPLSAAAQQMLATLPAHLQPYFDGYVGIDPQWRPTPVPV